MRGGHGGDAGRHDPAPSILPAAASVRRASGWLGIRNLAAWLTGHPDYNVPGAMASIPGLMMCREVFRRLAHPSAPCTVRAKVLRVPRVVCRCREDREVQAALGKAARPPQMDPGDSGGRFPSPVWNTFVARGCGSSCLLLWEASASLQASVSL